MHPLLRSPKNFLVLGFVWSPIVLSVIVLESALTNMTFSVAAVLVGPPMIVELFACLSTWYICRSFFPDTRNFMNLIITHGIAATVITSVWLLLAFLYSRGLDYLKSSHTWSERFDKAFPLLLAVGFFLYFLACLFHYLILSLEKSQKAEQQALENHLMASQAELNSLKSFIHPHFLFNSLTALSVLTKKSPKLAQNICVRLSDFLRYSLTYGQQEWVSVRDEWGHIDDYLEVEKIRLGDRLKLKYDIHESTFEERLPPFTLLPLIENAIKHTYQQRNRSCSLSLQIKKIPDALLIVVSNPYDVTAHSAKGQGQGLKILKQRLMNMYGENVKLRVERDEKIFCVKLFIPVKNKERDE